MSVLRREVIKEDVRVKRRQLEVGDLEDAGLRPSGTLATGSSSSHLTAGISSHNTLDPRLLQQQTTETSSPQSTAQHNQIFNRGCTLPAKATDLKAAS